MKKRDVFELKIDPDQNLEVGVISLVSDPAVNYNYLTFSKQEKPKKYEFAKGADQYEIFGVAMVPDVLIPRYDKVKDEEFDVVFSKETIRQIAQNFFLKNYHHKINIEHSNIFINATTWQSYIVDSKIGVNAPTAFGDVPDGSWIVGLKLDETDSATMKAWEGIKDGTIFKGFSIEGFFADLLLGTVLKDEEDDSVDGLIKDLLDLL